jgi:hypothetical protein
MYKIKTTDFFFAENGIDNNLRNIEVVKTISDDCYISKFHDLYVVYSSKYKIEFCFHKDRRFEYVMIEENASNEDVVNPDFELIDDFHLFEKTLNDILSEISYGMYDGSSMKTGNSEIYFSEDKADSIYIRG